jgi:hypothetical protein
MSFDWKSVQGFDKIRFSWTDMSSPGDKMEFPGYKGDMVDGMFIKLNLFGFISTRGRFLEEFFYSDEDLQLAQNIYNIYGVNIGPFTSEYMFKAIDLSTKQMSNNTISAETSGDLTVNRIQQKQYYQSINYTISALERYVMPFPLKKTFLEANTNISCLNVNCPFDEIDSWVGNVVTIFSDQDVPETYTINKMSDECYFISAFDGAQTTTGTNIERGKIYKLSNSNSIEILRTNKDNRILHFWKN